MRTCILFDLDYLIDSQQMYVHDGQVRDQDDNQNKEEARANTSALMSVERQLFGGGGMGQGCLVQVSVFQLVLIKPSQGQKICSCFPCASV